MNLPEGYSSWDMTSHTLGMAIEHDFWATSAQTLPVLALAQIIEARAIMSRWSRNGRFSVLQRIMMVTWAVPIIAYGYLIPSSLLALRDGAVPDYYAAIITNVVSVGVGVLILSPMLNILAYANSGAIAHSVVFLYNLGRRVRFLGLSLWFWRWRGKLREVILLMQEKVTRLEVERAKVDDQGFSSAPIASELDAHLERWSDRLSDMLALWGELESNSAKFQARKQRARDRRPADVRAFEVGFRRSLTDSEPTLFAFPGDTSRRRRWARRRPSNFGRLRGSQLAGRRDRRPGGRRIR
ncbi:hypothetical protein EV138_3024 [Kribbella voronezhensis]|uniref:Uncharacterized protein n=1 Tax=Kribbella voronezhensis TaxID=2512212 RepID=A0A4R7TD86_9ACTN|nr:hypothetical protein EV138_3024 [Kribbella voronezhensis]